MNIQLISVLSSRPPLMVPSSNRTTVHFLRDNGIFNWTRFHIRFFATFAIRSICLCESSSIDRLSQEYNLQHKSDHVGRKQCKYPFAFLAAWTACSLQLFTFRWCELNYPFAIIIGPAIVIANAVYKQRCLQTPNFGESRVFDFPIVVLVNSELGSVQPKSC